MLIIDIIKVYNACDNDQPLSKQLATALYKDPGLLLSFWLQDPPTYDYIQNFDIDDYHGDDGDDDAIGDDLLLPTSTPAVLRTPGRLFPSNRQDLSTWVGDKLICVFVTVSLYLCIYICNCFSVSVYLYL